MNAQPTSVRPPMISKLVHDAEARGDARCDELDKKLDEVISTTQKLKRKLTPDTMPAVRAPTK